MIRRKTYTRASHPVERIFLYTTGPIPETLVGNQYWIVEVDNYTRYSWSFFMKTKSKILNKTEELFENKISHGDPVKYLRCDNAGEKQ